MASQLTDANVIPGAATSSTPLLPQSAGHGLDAAILASGWTSYEHVIIPGSGQRLGVAG